MRKGRRGKGREREEGREGERGGTSQRELEREGGGGRGVIGR